MNSRVPSFVVAALAASVVACGDGDRSQVVESSSVTACDWTGLATSTSAVSTPRACRQTVGTLSQVEAARTQCLNSNLEAVVRWHCPGTGTGGAPLVGCCTKRSAGVETTLCTYDAAMYATAEADCRAGAAGVDPAVWTTTVPIPQFA